MKTKLKTFQDFLPDDEAVQLGENAHGVPKKEWRKWGKTARATFNGLYSEMMACQRLFMHPKAVQMLDSDWKTVCWNAAWIAATHAENAIRRASVVTG